MRLNAVILCAFLYVVTMVMPSTHLHAHLGHDQRVIHDGHEHHVDHLAGNSDDAQTPVVYLSEGISQLDGSGDLPMVPWLPLLYVAAVLLMVVPRLRRLPGPRCRREIRVPSQYPPRPPPLRGPPLSI